MPQIPIINAPPNAPTLQIPRTSPGTFGAGGFQAMGDIGQIWTETEAKLQGAADEVTYSGIVSGLHDQADQMIRTPDPTKTPEEYHQQVIKDLTQSATQSLDAIKSPMARQRAQANLTQRIEGYGIEARTGANAALHDRTLAATENLNDLDATAFATAPPQNRAGITASVQERLKSLVDAQMMTPVQAEKVLRTWMEKADINAATQDSETDPYGVADILKAGAYPGITDPVKRESLRVSFLKKGAILQDKSDKEIERVHKEKVNALDASYTADILEGKDVTSRLIDSVRSGDMTGAGARALNEFQQKIVTRADRESDEEFVTKTLEDINTPGSKVTMKIIRDNAYRLSTKDQRMLANRIGELDAMRGREAKADTREQQADANVRYAEAHETILRELTPVGEVSPQTKRTIDKFRTMAIEDLQARASGRGRNGKEDARTVAFEVLDRAKDAISRRLRKDSEIIHAGIPPAITNRGVLQQMYQAGQVTRDEVLLYGRRFLQIEAAEQFEAQQAIQQATPAAKAGERK